jgi:hypothetical protein
VRRWRAYKEILGKSFDAQNAEIGRELGAIKGRNYSQRRACYRYVSKRRDDSQYRQWLKELALERRRFGHWRVPIAESGATRTPIPTQGGQQSGDCGQQVMAA